MSNCQPGDCPDTYWLFLQDRLLQEGLKNDMTILAAYDLNDFIVNYGYLGIFIFFVTVDQLTPIPEEVSLLTIGYFSAHGTFNPFLAGLFSLLGFLTADIAFFLLARSGNKFFLKHFAKREDSWFSRYAKKLREHYGKTLLILNFIPRMRMFGPILVGMLKMDFRKFLFYNTIGLLALTVIFIALGMFFHRELHKIAAGFKHFEDVIFIGAMIVLAIIILVIIKRRRAHRKAVAP